MLWTTEASGDACYLLPIFYHISHLACRQDHIIVFVCEFFILFAHIVRVYDQIKLELFKLFVSHTGAKSWTTPQLTDLQTANHLETLQGHYWHEYRTNATHIE